MGKRNKSNLVLRGTASVSAFLLAFTSFGSVCAESYASQVNSFLGVKTSKWCRILTAQIQRLPIPVLMGTLQRRT